MRKIIFYFATVTLLCMAHTDTHAQKLINKVGKGLQRIDQAVTNKVNEKNNEMKPANPTGKTHKVGKIEFFNGTTNATGGTAVSTIDLSQSYYMRASLDGTLMDIKNIYENRRQYDVIVPNLIITYYINGQAIVTHVERLDDHTFRNNKVLSNPIVPTNRMDFKDNEFPISLLAHVVSNLNPGNYTFKVDYNIVTSVGRNATDGSASIEYDNTDRLVASGEVNLMIEAQSRDAFCKNYGRPKYSKGVLDFDAALEQQVKQLIERNTKHKPIYIFANDNFEYKRGALDRILARQVLCYYVFTNASGRCEISPFFIKQEFDGQHYAFPVQLIYNDVFFRYGVCQNY